MDVKTDQYLIEVFRHYSLRLSERYGILISYHEYMDMCNTYFCIISKTITRTKVHYVGFIVINRQKVKVVKHRDLLITALPFKKSDEQYF